MYQPQTSQPDYTWIIVLGLCILLFCSSVVIGIWKKDEISDFLGFSESSESPSATPSPSPVNCEIDWTNASWKPCDANICVAKGNEYPMYHYRTGTITQTSQHGGRACDSLLQFKTVGYGTAYSESASDPASSESASDPASSEPASDPASSESASDPASSEPASSESASSLLYLLKRTHCPSDHEITAQECRDVAENMFGQRGAVQTINAYASKCYYNTQTDLVNLNPSGPNPNLTPPSGVDTNTFISICKTNSST